MKQVQILFALTLIFSAAGCSQGNEPQTPHSKGELHVVDASSSVSTRAHASQEYSNRQRGDLSQPIQKVEGYDGFLALWADPQLATRFFHSYYYGGDKRLALRFERTSPGAKFLRITRWWNEYRTPFEFQPNTPSGNMLDSISVDDIEVIAQTPKQLTLAFISRSGDVQREEWEWRNRNRPSYVARFEYTRAWRYNNVHEVMTFPLNQEGKIDPKPAAASSRGSRIPENSAVAMAYRTANTYRNSDMPDAIFFNFNSCNELSYSNLNLKMAPYEQPLYCFVPEIVSHWAFLAPESQISEALELQAEADLKARENTPCGKTEIALTSAYSAAEKLHYKIQSSMLYGPRLPEIDYFSLVERFSREKKDLLARFDSMTSTCKSQIDTYAKRMDALLGEFKADEDMARRIWGQ